MYNIRVQQFEGPFEMLVELIEQKKLSINQVSLAEIANQYLDYLKELEQFPLGEASSFVVVAATLMLIKSRSLMPSLKLSQGEEREMEDLERQLKLYKQFKDISGEIEKILDKKVIFAPEESRVPSFQGEDIFIPPEDLSLKDIKRALSKMIARIPQKETLPETVVKKTVTLEEKMNTLIERLESKVNLCFSELKDNPECKKVDLIVSFLAVLELLKRDFIRVDQGQMFGEINIMKNRS